LYFGRARTPEGVFYKDYDTDPKIPGSEYIEFDNPVDLRQLEMLTNFYGKKRMPVMLALRFVFGSSQAARLAKTRW
jgi:hypothetical protein